MNKAVKIYIMAVIFAAVSLSGTSVLYPAPETRDADNVKKKEVQKLPKVTVKENDLAGDKISSASSGESSGFVSNAGNLITIAGGYYMPKGNMASYLDPIWSVKLTYQDNRRNGTPIGLGADLIYAYPPDKEVDGGLMIITAAPHVSLTIPFFSFMDLQFKAGPGLTVLTAVLDAGKKASADMTLHCGGNISRVFAGSFYMGMGSDAYYIFERKNLITMNSWFAMGYRW
jgi:hypothetical protein